MGSVIAVLVVLIGAQSLAMAQSTDESSAFTSIVNNRSLESRVLGGGDAAADDWPSVIALVQAGDHSLQDRLFCGGTVVGSHWVLTAAHCLHDFSNNVIDPSALRVVGGITNLQTQAGAVETEIASIIIHPEYDPFQELPPNDIALLELQTPLNVSAATLFAGESEAHAGELAWVAGWGATSYERDIPGNYPAALQDAAVPLVFNSECNSPQSYDGLITPTHLCAGFVDGEVDACAGDSGGPLFVIENDVPQQIGITSFGNGCGLPLFYGIYTNVSHFIPWLANYIEVPYQSPELVASRQEIVNVPVSVLPANTPASTPANTPGSSTGTQASATNSRSFTGASGSVWLCLIAMALGLRRRFINAYISSERI